MADEILVSIVDDEEDVRCATVALLRSSGIAARAYGSAEAFLASQDAASCGCLVTDVHMPGMDGLELMRRLRDRGSKTAVILITAYPSAQLRESAEALGAKGFFEKPVDASKLLSCVESCIG